MNKPAWILCCIGMTLLPSWILGCAVLSRNIGAPPNEDYALLERQVEAVLDYVEGKVSTLTLVDFSQHEPQWRIWSFGVNDTGNAPTPDKLKEAEEFIAAVQGIRASYEPLEAYKACRAVGEDNRDFVALRDCEYLRQPGVKNQAQQIISQENKGRKALHKRTAIFFKALDISVGLVEQLYALKRLERAESGAIAQLPQAGAAFEDFRLSAKGQALGPLCIPESWVTLR